MFSLTGRETIDILGSGGSTVRPLSQLCDNEVGDPGRYLGVRGCRDHVTYTTDEVGDLLLRL